VNNNVDLKIYVYEIERICVVKKRGSDNTPNIARPEMILIIPFLVTKISTKV